MLIFTWSIWRSTILVSALEPLGHRSFSDHCVPASHIVVVDLEQTEKHNNEQSPKRMWWWRPSYSPSTWLATKASNVRGSGDRRHCMLQLRWRGMQHSVVYAFFFLSFPFWIEMIVRTGAATSAASATNKGNSLTICSCMFCDFHWKPMMLGKTSRRL